MSDTEAELTLAAVNRREWGPSEDDEEQVLRELYGELDKGGIYRGPVYVEEES